MTFILIFKSRTLSSRILLLALLGAMFNLSGQSAFAQQSLPIIYPSQGQTMEQQAQDEGGCRSWAQQQTGFNPQQGPTMPQSSGNTGGQVLKGAAAGAALGAVGGAISKGSKVGRGAAIGVGVGAAAGLMRSHQDANASQQAQAQAIAQYNQQLTQYNRAFGTCMQGRGYAVNF